MTAWEHFKAILWLRRRLFLNQFARRGSFSVVLMAIAVVAGCVAGVGALVMGFLGGYFGMTKASPEHTMLIWDVVVAAFLFLWTIGLLTELQRSEMIDIHALMRFPVSLKEIFAINFAASHFTFGLVIAGSAMTGMILGLALGKSVLMLLLLPTMIGFVLMITAWTYCLRGWLASLMSNQRRRRAIVVGLSAVFILLSQIPNLYFNVLRTNSPRKGRRSEAPFNAAGAVRSFPSQEWLMAHSYVPFLWLPKGAMALAERNAWPALLGALGTAGIGALGLRQSYRSTLRFYFGSPDKKLKSRKVLTTAESPAKPGVNVLERDLPGIPEAAAAMTLNTSYSMWRAPEMKLGLATSIGTMAIMGSALLLRNGARAPASVKPFIVTGAVVFVIFSLLQILFNQFGFDRDGFRTLMLSPAPRKQILLGKNLALVPLVLAAGLVFLFLVRVVGQASFVTVAAGFFQLLGAFFLACMGGNWASIMLPYRIAPGSMKPTKPPIKMVFALFFVHILFPVWMAPIFAPPFVEFLVNKAVPGNLVPLNLLFSAAIAGGLACSYWFSLDAFGRLFQKREIAILGAVTHDIG